MVFQIIGDLRRLRKSKRVLRFIHRLYKRKEKHLSIDSKEAVQKFLTELKNAILKKDSIEAQFSAERLQQTASRFMPKSSFDKVRDFVTSISFALFVAVLVRTMWFELYTIPSGSMRPTLKENDYLVVSKTDYGINVPLKPKHFYFDDSLVKRGSIIVFNGANMDIADNDTTYFFLFPGKKQFVKRLIGKPGDTIYFYGGQIYGIDRDGNEITDFRNFGNLEHIPYIRFDGKVETPNPPTNGFFSPVIFHQMNQPIAKLSINSIGTIQGEMIQKGVSNYSDFLGTKHFAMARLLTKAELDRIHPGESRSLDDAPLYLELQHHPSLQGAKLTRDEYNRIRPELAISTSFIALHQSHLDYLAKQMTTCRFIVKSGKAYRFGSNPKETSFYLPTLAGVPDGTYEIQNGVVYKLPCTWLPIFGGISYAVSSKHPLYQYTPEKLQTLYNLGIEFLTPYAPQSQNQRALPSRYAYFRNQDLYLLNGPIIEKDDPTLLKYIKRETEKQSIATSLTPYQPFLDNGPPTLEEIRKNGIKIPEKMYLALGDNHAMSADSRQFGFVPEDNLKGGVSFLFSPPGSRWGRAPQPAISHLTFPNIAIWSLFILTWATYGVITRRKLKKPFEFS